jgi:hypothetical protein
MNHGPYRPGNQHNRAKYNPDLDRTTGDPVPFKISFNKVKNTCDKGDKKSQKGQECCGNMQIEYFLNNTHCFFNRCINEYGIYGRKHRNTGDKVKR